MKTACLKTLLVVLFTLPLFAQVTTTRKTPTPVKHVTTDDVIGMAAAGLSDDLIIARLRKEDRAFDLSPDDMIRLKKAKIGDTVLKVMMDPKAEVSPSAPQTPQPVVIPRPVIAGLPNYNPSGATPSPGTNTSGDLNDPLVPHDSGIYLYTKDRDGKPQMIVLERASYQGAKTGGMLASAMTYGLKKTKTKAVIPGARASIRVSDVAPVFYFYFDDKQAGLGKTYFGTNSISNPSQFALLKLEVKKSDRETVIGQFGTLGASSGTDANAMIPFKSERIRTGLYKVTADSMKAGEYCFLASSGVGTTGMAAAYGVGMTRAADIFDFGMDLD
jgi:hypothetical protein